MSLSDVGRFLNVSAERTRQIAADDPTFPAPASEQPRRWNRAKVQSWAERHRGTRDPGGCGGLTRPLAASEPFG
jgi:hypothetical protein